VAIHQKCLQEWLDQAENPFQCTVCKGDYAGTFLNKFLTAEDILFHPKGEEGDEEEDFGEMTFYEFHGIPIIETEDDLLFRTEEHRSIYHQLVDNEYRAIKQESRHGRQTVHRRYLHRCRLLPVRNVDTRNDLIPVYA
jgi:hypothetical protein